MSTSSLYVLSISLFCQYSFPVYWEKFSFVFVYISCVQFWKLNNSAFNSVKKRSRIKRVTCDSGWWSCVLVSLHRWKLQGVSINWWDVHFSTAQCCEFPTGSGHWHTILDSLQSAGNKGPAKSRWDRFSPWSKWSGEMSYICSYCTSVLFTGIFSVQ